jgi:hypothetical protein
MDLYYLPFWERNGDGTGAAFYDLSWRGDNGTPSEGDMAALKTGYRASTQKRNLFKNGG